MPGDPPVRAIGVVAARDAVALEDERERTLRAGAEAAGSAARRKMSCAG